LFLVKYVINLHTLNQKKVNISENVKLCEVRYNDTSPNLICNISKLIIAVPIEKILTTAPFVIEEELVVV
jgi:hypothetical protein